MLTRDVRNVLQCISKCMIYNTASYKPLKHFWLLLSGRKMNAPGDKKPTKKDVSQLIKETEAAKRVAHINEVFLKTITESLPQYVFWKDTHSVYLGCNKNYARLVGLSSPEDIVGKTDQDLYWQVTGDTAEVFQQGDKDTIAGQPITNQEEVLALPNGTTLITLVSKLPIIDNNEVIGIVGYFTDITELKYKEKELVKAKQEAEAANIAKSAFITNISHDIRTPLTGMIGMSRILQKAAHDQQSKTAASNLLKSGNILLDLLNEVIEMAKLDSGELPVHEVKFSMKELVHDLGILVTPSANEKSLTLTIHYDEDIPHYVLGDQTRLHRVLLNLVSNAIKFTKEGKVDIFVKLVKAEERDLVVKILVKDTGIGIPEKDKKLIFSKFNRLDPAYKGKYQGFGLGLAIVKQFISEMEGEVYVDSEPEVGSTFTCILPLKKSLLDDPANLASPGKEAISQHELTSMKQYNAPHILDQTFSRI